MIFGPIDNQSQAEYINICNSIKIPHLQWNGWSQRMRKWLGPFFSHSSNGSEANEKCTGKSILEHIIQLTGSMNNNDIFSCLLLSIVGVPRTYRMSNGKGIDNLFAWIIFNNSYLRRTNVFVVWCCVYVSECWVRIKRKMNTRKTIDEKVTNRQTSRPSDSIVRSKPAAYRKWKSKRICSRETSLVLSVVEYCWTWSNVTCRPRLEHTYNRQANVFEWVVYAPNMFICNISLDSWLAYLTFLPRNCSPKVS